MKRALVGLLAVPLVVAQAYAYPPRGIDSFDTTVTIDLCPQPCPCTTPMQFILQGSTAVKRGDPVPGPVETIPTELVYLSLVNFGIGVSEATGGSDPGDADDPPCTVAAPGPPFGAGCSPGSIAQVTPGMDFPADSFFDVFVKISIGSPMFMDHYTNVAPIRMAATINSIPSYGHSFASTSGCVDFYDTGNPMGPPVLSLGPMVVQQVFTPAPATETPTASPTPQGGCPSTPKTGCVPATKSVLKIGYDAGATYKNLINWKWSGATAFAQFGSPTTVTGYELCIYDDDVLSVQVDVEPDNTCDGDPCWRSSSTAHFYKNRSGNADGVRVVKQKDGGSIKLKAKGSSVPLSGGPLPFADAVGVTVQYSRADGVECWEAEYPAAPAANDANKFKDKL